jgi:hypothetical protein
MSLPNKPRKNNWKQSLHAPISQSGLLPKISAARGRLHSYLIFTRQTATDIFGLSPGEATTMHFPPDDAISR